MFSRLYRCTRGLQKYQQNIHNISRFHQIPVSHFSSSIDSEPIAECTKTLVTSLPDHSILNMVSHYQTLLDTIQVTSGLPWWGILIGSGFLIRVSLLPFNVLYEKKLLKNMPHKKALFEFATEINSARIKEDHVLCLTKLEEKSHYKLKNNYNWKKSENFFLLPSICVLCINFMSIRGLTELPYETLYNSSFFWLTNLCHRDPYYILPMTNALASAYVLKKGIDSGENAISNLLSSTRNMMIFFAIMGSCQALFPSALVIYWLSSNLTGIAVIRPLLTNDQFRKLVGLLPIEEKKELLKSFQPAVSFSNDVTSSYNETRKYGHEKDMEQREERFLELDAKEQKKS